MLRAVDLQQVLMQSNSVERVQQVQQQQPDIQQRYFDVQLNEERKLRQEQVKDTEETERARIREKEEQERRRKEKDNRKRVEDGKTVDYQEDNLNVAVDERRVDIKI